MTNRWPDTPALLLIDVQKAFDSLEYYGGERNNPEAEANCGRLLGHWRAQGWPIIHIRHASVVPGSPLAPGHPGHAFKDEALPLEGEPVLTKNVNSGFIGTGLQALLDQQGIRTVVLAGLTTEHCVSTTTRMAANLGYRTVVASDATAAFRKKGLRGEVISAETVWQVSLATLNEEFALVVPTTEIVGKAVLSL
jgi:nicotinamidase-related amidase